MKERGEIILMQPTEYNINQLIQAHTLDALMGKQDYDAFKPTMINDGTGRMVLRYVIK